MFLWGLLVIKSIFHKRVGYSKMIFPAILTMLSMYIKDSDGCHIA